MNARGPRIALVALPALALVAVWLRLAWIGDDACITLRTVENLLAGHGPVWNVGERVQAYTHPLWMGLLAALRVVTGEPWFTTIALSIVCSGLAAAIVAVLGGRASVAAAVLVVLLCSRALGDYATSGLETPLAALLLAWLARLDDAPPGGARPGRVMLALALLGTTRLDLVLLAAPVAFAHLRAVPLRRWPVAALALLPLAAWSAFAAFYYGSPFPITAYAKAFAHGVPAGDLARQGLCYVQYSLRHDPATLVAIAAGVGVGLASRTLRGRMLAVGIALYCGYVVRVGGDFMAGRFFVPPLVAAVALLARALRERGPGAAVAVAAVALAFVPGVPPFLRSIADDSVPIASEHGVIDERRFYFARNGLVSPELEIPDAGSGTRALRAAGRTRPLIAKCDAVGRDPFVAGELFHFVDRWIVDPLLMRLPIARPGEWRIGHFTRGVPDGYLEALAHGTDRIGHPGLRAFAADLHLVLRAPLFDRARLAALWRLWTGAHDEGLAAYVADQYRTPPRRIVRAADLPAAEGRTGTFWFDDARAVLLGEGGLAVEFAEPVVAATLRVALTPLARYRCAFVGDGRVLATTEVVAVVDLGPPPPPERLLAHLQLAIGFGEYEVAVPEAARGFDRLELDADAAPLLVPALGGVTVR